MVEVEVERSNGKKFQCFYSRIKNVHFPLPQSNSTHTKKVAAAVRPEAPRPRASEGKAASETGGWRGTMA